MTKQEFENWKAETARSAHKWQIDPIHNQPTDTLIYKGGEDGHFINVSGNRVVVGTYEGAIPHIGEALFRPVGTVECRDNKDAWKRLLERAGVPFLLELFAR